MESLKDQIKQKKEGLALLMRLEARVQVFKEVNSLKETMAQERDNMDNSVTHVRVDPGE